MDSITGNSDQRGGNGPATGGTIFRTGHNCWAVTRADAAAVRIDSSAYFRAFMRAALRARETLFIVGWDFHSRAQLLCEGETLEDDPAAPRLLGDFLNYLAERRRGLRIRVLIWDFPSVFGVEREFPFFYGSVVPGSWQPHRHIHLRFDSSHRFGGSHHQKIVVIDDNVAFCGGIDLTRARWDTCEHRADNAHRSHDGKGYSPVHDVAMQVEGETARALGHLVRRRWRRAGGTPVLPGPRRMRSALLQRQRALRAALKLRRRGTPALTGARIAISRTYAAGVDGPQPVREVEAMYVDMIRAARRWILIENQYFTADAPGRALEERLREPDGPEVVVILRLLSHGWLEEMTMERLRTQLIRRLRAVAGERRVRVYYPYVTGLGEGSCVDVHSKLMIVDDRYLRVGSSNFANRSMGVDTECDLTLEAVTPADHRFVRETTARLLSEHLGCEPDTVLEHLDGTDSLIATLDALGTTGDRRLEQLPALDQAPSPPALARLGDPEAPIELDTLRDLLASDDEGLAPQTATDAQPSPHSRRRTLLLVAAVIVVALGLTAVWRYSPLADYFATRVVGWARTIGRQPWAPLIVLFAYTPGCWVFFPRPFITLFAVIAFGPWLGFTWSLAGLVTAALFTYFVGTRMSPTRVTRLMGPKLRGIVDVLRRRGLVAMTAMRLVPLAPFAIEGVAAGALRIRLRHFALGSAIGLTPGTLTATVLSDQVQAALDPDARVNWWLLAGLGVILVAATWWVRRWFQREQAQHGVTP